MNLLSPIKALRVVAALVALAAGSPIGLGITAGLVFGPTPAFAEAP